MTAVKGWQAFHSLSDKARHGSAEYSCTVAQAVASEQMRTGFLRHQTDVPMPHSSKEEDS